MTRGFSIKCKASEIRTAWSLATYVEMAYAWLTRGTMDMKEYTAFTKTIRDLGRGWGIEINLPQQIVL